MLQPNKPFRTWALIIGLLGVAILLLTLDVDAPLTVCNLPVVLFFVGAALLWAQEIRDGMR